MEVIRAYAWYSRHPGGDEPPRRAVKDMLTTIERELDAQKARPVSLVCRSWPSRAFPKPPDEDFLACIAISIEPGEMIRRLPSWYEWQHPRWVFAATAPAHMIEQVTILDHVS